jgi:soluble calcium-activated nucleotidase 1
LRCFLNLQVQPIGKLIPVRGFSSFKFIPSTHDTVIAALKTEEFNGTSATYITAFTVDGNVLLPESKISDLKYEGLEFI